MRRRSDFIYETDQSWTLFLDRDGVINKRLFNGYITSLDEFEFLPGVLEAFYNFEDRFVRNIVITNQQCISKGIISHADLAQIHEYMVHQVESAHGHIDEIYYSPDLANLPSITRKPAPGLALQAQKDYKEIDFKKSIMVGDTESDIDFGRNLGMYTVYLTTSPESHISAKSDLVVGSLLQFSLLLQRKWEDF
jgi:histidinol-phosphate phosphatase family protein